MCLQCFPMKPMASNLVLSPQWQKCHAERARNQLQLLRMDTWQIKEKHSSRGRCQSMQKSVIGVIHFILIQVREPKETEWNWKSTLRTLNMSKFNWEANSVQFNMCWLRTSHVPGPILNNRYIPIAIYTYLSIIYLSIDQLIYGSIYSLCLGELTSLQGA